MILRNLQNSPEKAIPVAITFVVVGLSILMIGVVWPVFSPSVPHLGTDWNDFFRGVIFGLAIALQVGGVIIALAAVAKKRRQL